MRTPDDDGNPDDGSVSTSVGDGFGASAGDLTEGFGDDDFSDDNSFDDTTPVDTDTTDTTGTDSTDSTDDGSSTTVDEGDGDGFGDGLSDSEAENVLVDILEDVFGDDAPEVLEDMEADSGLDPSELYDGLSSTFDLDGEAATDTGVEALQQDEGLDPFEPSEIPSESDFDLTTDGHVDGHDLQEAVHPFDFGVSE